MKNWNLKKWARAYFAYGAREFIKNGKRILPDYSGKLNIFIDPFGDIYPCDISIKKIGKLKDSGFTLAEEWPDDNACEKSWMVCTARPAIKKHWLKVGIWILKEKFKRELLKLKNYCLYLLGLFIAILNKLRRIFTGYRNPRPISGKKILDNIKYDYEVVNNFERRIKDVMEAIFSFKNKDVLEIGPGPDLGTGLFFMGRGVKSYTAIDKFKLIADNKNFYEKLIDFSAGKREVILDRIKKVTGELKFFNGKNEIVSDNFKYLNMAAEDMANISNEYDLIVSQAVLEHIDNPLRVFKNMHGALKEGGIICHEIDFKTHTSFIRDFDPLNILRYGDRLYDKIKFKGSPNRLRINDYKKIAEEAGFKNIIIIPLNELNNAEVLQVKNNLAKPFADYEDENLKVLSAVLIARK
jgi:SAM-dependent methyltransferase